MKHFVDGDEYLIDPGTESPDCLEDEEEPLHHYVVDIPSEVRPGEWWEWGTFDSLEEAVKTLRENGIPVDDEGKLQLVSKLPYD